MMKKISVIIPVFNSEYTLEKCLTSLFKNTYDNFEVIIVDDCSVDRSVEIIKKYPCQIIRLSEQRGPSYARDKGQAAASGEIVAFLDSDCIAPTDWLDKIEAKLTSDIIGIGGRYILPESIGTIQAFFITSWDFKNLFYRKAKQLVSLSGGNCAFWKYALEQKRKKSELAYCNRMVGGDDTIMCCELSKFGKLIFDPDLYVVHNKEYSMVNILKETINLGYSGAILARLFGNLLIKEPHRIYKSILYFVSMLLFFILFLLPQKEIRSILSIFLIFYIAIQLPIMLMGGYLRGKANRLLFPVVTFIVNLLHFVGHLKRVFYILEKILKSIAWYIKIFVAVINPFALFRIFLFVTKKCNASCYFCFNKKTMPKPMEEDLSVDEIKKTVRDLPFLPWLTITGGEPFLRKDIFEICKLFYLGCGARIISIVTNGTAPSYIQEITEKILIDCDQIYLTIIVAIDDIAEKHDEIKGIKGCYKEALKTLGLLNNLQFRFPRLTLGINTLITEGNSSRIEEILGHFSNTLTFDRQCLNLLRTSPSAAFDEKLISIQRYLGLIKLNTFQRRLVKSNYSLLQKFNISLLDYISENAQEVLTLKREKDICLAAKKFFVIDNNGDVFACELLNEKLGNLREVKYDIKKIISSAKVEQVRTAITNSKCYCLWPCATATNTYLRILSYPKIVFRAITKTKK